MKLKSALQGLAATLIGAAALVLLNVLACGSRSKMDLTEYGIYSLSRPSKQIVRRIPEKLFIKAYFGNVPAEQAEQQRYVENLLAEYADASGGKVVYEKYEVDASDKPSAADRQKELAEDGIPRLMIPVISPEGRKLVPAYFNVQFSYLDKKETWQLPDSGFAAEGLEYEYTTIIKRLIDGKQKLGVTVGFGEPARHQVLDLAAIEAGSGTKIGLADLYDIVPVDWSKDPQAIENVDVLLVNAPTQKVSEAAQWQLDQHIMRGKPAILLLPGMEWKPGGGPEMQIAPGSDTPFVGTPIDNGLKDLLASYGFEIGQDTILDLVNGIPGLIPIGGDALEARFFFPLVAALKNGKNDPVAGMRALPLPYTSTLKLIGPLEEGKREGYQVTDLFATSPTSFARSDFLAVTRRLSLRTPDDASQRGPYVVGVAVEGSWKSFFAGKAKPAGATKPPAENAEEMISEAETATIEESRKPARLVVISSGAPASDQTVMQMRYTGQRAYLNPILALHSIVDWTAENTDLLAVRAKQVLRPIEGVSKRERLTITYGNVIGVPLGFVVFGVVYWLVRERRRRRVRI